jgi:glycosyltransferase involved in cell wall biosynthesis
MPPPVRPPASPRVSLVIPAYNESALLPRLLDTVTQARARYAEGPDAIEVIVADNGSTDDTAAIALRYGCRVVRVAPRNIGAVRNGGAREARGEFLCFVDADGRVHPEVFNVVAELLSTGRYSIGATGVIPERWSVGIACTFAVLVPLLWITRIDTGLIFCRRDDFNAVGGYDERWFAAEDVKLHLAMIRAGRARGQRAIRARQVKGIASMRKFTRYGDWHYFTLLPHGLAILFRKGGLTAMAQKYWYVDTRD